MKTIKTAVFSVIGLGIGSLIFLLGAIFYTTIGTPSKAEIDRRFADIKHRQETAGGLESSLAEWRAIEKTYREFKNTHLYRFARFPEFRQTLNSLLNRAQLRVSRFNYKIRQSLEDIVRVSIDFDVEGAYGSVKRFIHDVERLEKILFFKKVQLSKGPSHIQGRISMEAYFVR